MCQSRIQARCTTAFGATRAKWNGRPRTLPCWLMSLGGFYDPLMLGMIRIHDVSTSNQLEWVVIWDDFSIQVHLSIKHGQFRHPTSSNHQTCWFDNHIITAQLNTSHGQRLGYPLVDANMREPWVSIAMGIALKMVGYGWFIRKIP